MARMAKQQEISKKIQEILDACDKEKYIFRGENKKHLKVSSTLYRRYPQLIEIIENSLVDRNLAPVMEVEKDIVERARLHFRPDASDIEVLTELRHLGGKTALIDFTQNVYVAIFFACNGNFKKDGRIILFNKSGIPEQFSIDYEERNKYTVVLPASKSPRVVFQSSVFVHTAEGYLEEDRYETVIIEKKFKKQLLDYLRREHDIEARTVYNDIQGFIQNQGDHPDAEENFCIGVGYHAAEQNDEAIKYYDKAIKLNPFFAEAFCNRGVAKSHLGDKKKAMKNYDKAIELNPEYAKAYNNRGNIKFDLENYEEAIRDYNKALKSNLLSAAEKLVTLSKKTIAQAALRKKKNHP